MDRPILILGEKREVLTGRLGQIVLDLIDQAGIINESIKGKIEIHYCGDKHTVSCTQIWDGSRKTK